MTLLTTLVGLIVLAAGTAAVCQKTCTSDAQCKGFTQVNTLRYCVQGCCSSYNTAVAVLTANFSACLGDIEAYTNTDANQYPFFAMIAQTNSAQENGCACYNYGALIAPGWVVNVGCSVLMTNNITVYFYLDDPLNRQVYRGVSAVNDNNNVNMAFVNIEYIGGGTPLEITPIPLNCNQAYLTSGTTITWYFANDTSKTRTAVIATHNFYSQAQCANNLELYCGQFTFPSMYCFDDQSPFLYSGSPLFALDNAGAFQFLGLSAHYPCFPETGSYTSSARVATFRAEVQQITGAACAS